VGAALERWRAAGFYVTLDDAGPPLPHWRKMLELPFTGIKLDASLAADAQAAKAEAAAIAEEAHRRGIYIVAEGIQDAGALARARALGVQAVQGFLFSRPLPAAAVPIWLRLWRARTPLQ
jgi:EAL domain-containing protein (putative c-di-GMP-specific phosphodiesterase class I)